MTDDVTDIVDNAEQEDQEISLPFRHQLSSYGADYPIDLLVDRLNKDHFFIPRFQRGFVWTIPQASRFIESLILGLPVPGIFLFKEPTTENLIVIDGQQRLLTLKYFYDGVIGSRPFVLKGVDPHLEGMTYESLDVKSQRFLDDSILHATVFQQDRSREYRSIIYQLFERLNTGGTPLSAQEIRSCVYRGRLSELLEDLNSNEDWRRIWGPRTSRAKDEEVILRVLALRDDFRNYSRPLKQFLNNYMDKHSNPSDDWINERRRRFEKTVKFVAEFVRREPFRRGAGLNVAITEAMLVGIWCRLEQGPIETPVSLRNVAIELRDNKEFVSATDSATTQPLSVHGRVQQAIAAFSNVR